MIAEAVMAWKHFSILGVVMALSCALHAANPFVGKWKIDEAKSQLAGFSDSIIAAGPNTWKFQDGPFSWAVKADGTEQPTPFGSTVALKVVNPSIWEFTNKSNGKIISTESWVLATDGKSMTRTFASKNQNGEPTKSASTMKRTAGTAGFEGTWESTEVKLGFTEVDIEAYGDDGITVRLPEDGTHYSLKFDGKEYPEEGPRLPAGMTVSAKITGPRTIEARTRLNGKLFDTEEWEVSEDGLTFTYKQQDEGDDKPVVIVQHRMGGQ
jgi:hypothetical protein